MIIEKLWCKETRTKLGIVLKREYKQGWFLLGFIPLYIKTYKVVS